jgi:hypothetical protein
MSGQHGIWLLPVAINYHLWSLFLLTGDYASESRIVELFGRPHR